MSLPLGPSSSIPRSFWLQGPNARILLRTGESTVGRSPICDMVVDDPRVSRRHARLIASQDGVRVEDLGSANGVFVNGERVTEPQFLRIGDELSVGGFSFRLGESDAPERPVSATTRRQPPERASDGTAAPSESTRQEDVIDLMLIVADRLVDAGKINEAEAALGPVLTETMRAAKESRCPESKTRRALGAATRLAKHTKKAAWLEYVLELGAVTRTLLPAEVVDELYDVLRKVPPIQVRLLRAYVEQLKKDGTARSPADLFILRRIEGLEALASAR